MINWYPGHMKKTRDLIISHKNQIDLIIELLDARAPLSSINPIFDDILSDKPRLKILNKADLADDRVTDEWLNTFDNAIKFDSKHSSKSDVLNKVKPFYNKVNEKLIAKGQKPRPIRVMVIGIPNVGKSSFINKIVGSNKAKIGNKPGVTKGKQWIRVDKDIELFDTPGILWPKFEDQTQARKLVFVGSIKDEILDIEGVAFHLLDFLKREYMKNLEERFKVAYSDDTLKIMDDIAINRGCILKGREIDYLRVSKIILGEFRDGKIGRISLERP